MHLLKQPAPELVGDEDDSPLQQDGGEDLQQPADAQALQQAVKVHVLQPGVHRAAQRQLLLDETTGQSQRVCTAGCCAPEGQEERLAAGVATFWGEVLAATVIIITICSSNRSSSSSSII